MTRTNLLFAPLFLAAIGLSSCAGQNIPQNKVPAVVINALGSARPEATTVEWEKIGENYEAEFDADSSEYTASINAAGNLVQTKRDLAVTELPDPILTFITTSHKDKKLDDVEIVVKDGKTYYQVELESNFKSTKLVFDQSGKEVNDFAYWD